MSSRSDVSVNLIHFTRGNSEDDAFATLRKIMSDRKLIAGHGMIRGGFGCVCFTEAPLVALRQAFVAGVQSARYSQFGLMFRKSWIYGRGGRPVIYQPGTDFDLLPEELQWRHVRFELIGEQIIDFAWEREWRIRCDELPFTERDTVVIVPNKQWAEELALAHDVEQDIEIQQYALVFNPQIAELWREDFPWHVMPLQ